MHGQEDAVRTVVKPPLKWPTGNLQNVLEKLLEWPKEQATLF